MSDIPDNDFHAFPTSSVDGFTQHGMTLRDWFAGQAVAGLFNHSGWVGKHDGDGEEVAKRAYAVADAMLKAREPS